MLEFLARVFGANMFCCLYKKNTVVPSCDTNNTMSQKVEYDDQYAVLDVGPIPGLCENANDYTG